MLHDLLERTQHIYPHVQARQLFSFTRPTTFRINRLKATKENVITQLHIEGFVVEPVAWYHDAYILMNKSLRELTESEVYKRGEIYVQSLSSMIPPLVLDPKRDEKILDLCAAPGSKTSEIASLIGNTGEILANDNSRIRIYKLKANLTLLGATNTKVHFGVGQTLWQEYPEYFDRTLVDVPCSMEGRISTDDEKTYKDWSVKKIKELSERQRWLLRGAISATKPNGIVIYSTCTLAPEENEGVIDWILKKEKGALVVDNISLSLQTYPGITSWKEKTYLPDVAKTIRILPSETMEGFFIAKLRKIQSNVIRHNTIDCL